MTLPVAIPRAKPRKPRHAVVFAAAAAWYVLTDPVRIILDPRWEALKIRRHATSLSGWLHSVLHRAEGLALWHPNCVGGPKCNWCRADLPHYSAAEYTLRGRMGLRVGGSR